MSRRRIFSSAFLGATAVLVACGSDVTPTDGTGGHGGGGPASQVSVASSGSGGAPVVGATSWYSDAAPAPVAVSTGVGGGGCELSDFMEGFFTDPDVNECAQASCCDELAACDPDVDPSACFDPEDGSLDTSLPTASALDQCVTSAGCFGAVVCDSGLVLEGDDQESFDLALCLGDNCCEEFTACTDGGADVEDCLSCLDAGEPYGEACAAAEECEDANCTQGFPGGLCESGLGTSDIETGICLEEHCCDAFNTCTDFAESEETILACLDCLSDGGGPLCDAAIACEAEFCSTDVCDSGIAYSDIETAQCLTANCCAEYTACAGPDPEDEQAIQACIDCFIAEGGPLCDAAIACTDDLCSDPGAGGGGAGGGGGGSG